MSRDNYKKIGDYIKSIKIKNKDLRATELLGININKFFMPSVANVVGTDLSRYKIVEKNQFACNRMHVGRDYRIPIALSKKEEAFMVSPAYDVFEITKTDELIPEYLMMWFSRKEFDRNAWFHTDADVRGGLNWKAFCDMELPMPTIEKQREIIKEYNTVVNRIKLNEQLNQKLEETAQALYKHWFVDFENHNNANMVSLDRYINVNPRLTIEKGHNSTFIEMASVQRNNLSIINITSKPYTSGTKFMNSDSLLARITPSLENGKSGFVDFLKPDEVAFGSTEFIVFRAKENISPFWNYCLTKDEKFRSYAISGMAGTSGRQRVDGGHIKKYEVKEIDFEKMYLFNEWVSPIFKRIKINSSQNQKLQDLKELLLSKMTKM